MDTRHKNSTYRGLKASPAGMALINAFFIVFCFLCLLPLLLVISISFSDELDVVNYGFRLIPIHFTTVAYRMIFEFPRIILNAYKVSIIVTVVSTVLNILISSMAAYPLSRPNYRFRRAVSFYFFFTMLFNGGLVPYYILMTQYLHLTDTILALIVPMLFSAYHAFLIRTNFQKLPGELVESAKIDGAGEFRIFSTIVMPLSTPTIATISLFVAISVWNDWYTSLLFINKQELYSLQMMLQMMMSVTQSLQTEMMSSSASDLINSRKIPEETLRMAMLIVSIGPILILFPFLQKYFVRGLTVGSVKG